MQIKKLALLMALMMGTGSSYAAFVDNRANDAVVEVSYKSISVEDLAADIVPREYVVDYTKPEQRKELVKISGKGTWSELLSQAAAMSPLVVYVDHNAKRIKFSERSTAVAPAPVAAVTNAADTRVAPAVARSSVVTAPAAAPVVLGAAAVSAAARSVAVTEPLASPASSTPSVPKAFTTTSSDYKVSIVLQRWAAQSGMQYVWEPRNVEFQINAENDWGTDLRTAVRDLLTSVQANQSAQAGRDRVRACIHPNKPKNVLRIIRFDERCQGAM